MNRPLHPSFRRRLLAVVAIAFAVGLAGCALQTGTITRAPTASFSFVGVVEGAVVTIDNGAPVTLTGSKRGGIVPTLPGRHQVRVSRDGVILVDREVLVGDLQIFEIALP